MLTQGGAYKTAPFLHVGATASANGETVSCLSAAEGAYTVVVVQILGITGDTVTFEGTLDGTNWSGVHAKDMSSGSIVTSATAAGLYQVTVLGLTAFRCPLTRVGGTVTVIANAVV